MQQLRYSVSSNTYVSQRPVPQVRTSRVRFLASSGPACWPQSGQFKQKRSDAAGLLWQRRCLRLAAFQNTSQLVPEQIPSDVKLELDQDTAAKEVTYDEDSKTIKIPLAALTDGKRRTKMVMFTCNKCGGRSARLVNPGAWENGAVFCQCQHCGVWHTMRAAKHIMEEIRYNDPEWQLDDVQPVTNAAVSTDGSQLDEPEQSSQTVLELLSGDEQEATSAPRATEQ